MTPADHRLAALLAALAPGRASALLARCGAGRDAVDEARRLAALSRRERLAALGRAVADPPGSGGIAPEHERPRLAAVVERVAAGLPPPASVSPLLVRAVRERLR
jgi:hypothetical protein